MNFNIDDFTKLKALYEWDYIDSLIKNIYYDSKLYPEETLFQLYDLLNDCQTYLKNWPYLERIVEWRKKAHTNVYCEKCASEFMYQGGESTCVGYCGPWREWPGHNHDNNCTSMIFKCNCLTFTIYPRNECPMCDWIGSSSCGIGHGPGGRTFTPTNEIPYGLGPYVKRLRLEDAPTKLVP